LGISFDDALDRRIGYVVRTPDDRHKGKDTSCYLSIMVRNRGEKEGLAVTPILEGISEKLGESLKPLARDCFWLCWAHRGYEKIQLFPKQMMFANILMTNDHESYFSVCIRHVPFLFKEFTNRLGTYIFHLAFCVDGEPPVRADFEFQWRGKWDDFSAHLKPPSQPEWVKEIPAEIT